MMIGALRTADRLALALQARAYRVRGVRTSYHELRFTALDGAILTATMIFALAFLYARFALGFGANPLFIQLPR